MTEVNMPDQSSQINLTKKLISEDVSVLLKSKYLSPLFGPKQYQLLVFPGRGKFHLLMSSMTEDRPLLNVNWVVSCLIF